VNKVILIGNLGQDPEIRNTNSGTAILQLRIATQERIKRGDEWVSEAEWHTVVVFGARAETCAKYLHKGSKVGVEGRIKTRKWQDKSGQDRYSTEIIADQVEFLSPAQGQGNSGQERSRGGSRDQGGQSTGGQRSDDGDPGFDDMPF